MAFVSVTTIGLVGLGVRLGAELGGRLLEGTLLRLGMWEGLPVCVGVDDRVGMKELDGVEEGTVLLVGA